VKSSLEVVAAANYHTLGTACEQKQPFATQDNTKEYNITPLNQGANGVNELGKMTQTSGEELAKVLVKLRKFRSIPR
jgi:hypothetical protein